MPYTVFKADLKKNKEDILSLWKRNFPDLPEERYQWIYENNPAGPASCWLIKETRQSKIVGATSLFPRRILLSGKQVTAGIAGDFAIDKEHRSLGPALLLQKAAIMNGNEKPYDILYGFPNKISEPVLLKAGYKILGEIHSLTKPLKSHYFLKKHVNLPFITKPLSFLADLGLKISSKERYRRNNEFLIETLTSFDRRFDAFWDTVSAQFQMIGDRSCAHLNWRYIQSPYKNYQVLALIRKRNRDLLGYIVYTIDENRSFIHDLLSLNMDEVFDPLLSGFLLHQRTKGIDAVRISFTGAHALMKKLNEYGFSVRTSPGKVIKYSAPGSVTLPDILDKENWYLLPGDNDI